MIDSEMFNGLVWRELKGKEIQDVLENATIEETANIYYAYVDADGNDVMSGTLLFIRKSNGTKGVVHMCADNDDYEYHSYVVMYAELPA